MKQGAREIAQPCLAALHSLTTIISRPTAVAQTPCALADPKKGTVFVRLASCHAFSNDRPQHKSKSCPFVPKTAIEAIEPILLPHLRAHVKRPGHGFVAQPLAPRRAYLLPLCTYTRTRTHTSTHTGTHPHTRTCDVHTQCHQCSHPGMSV